MGKSIQMMSVICFFLTWRFCPCEHLGGRGAISAAYYNTLLKHLVRQAIRKRKAAKPLEKVITLDDSRLSGRNALENSPHFSYSPDLSKRPSSIRSFLRAPGRNEFQYTWNIPEMWFGLATVSTWSFFFFFIPRESCCSHDAWVFKGTGWVHCFLPPFCGKFRSILHG